MVPKSFGNEAKGMYLTMDLQVLLAMAFSRELLFSLLVSVSTRKLMSSFCYGPSINLFGFSFYYSIGITECFY